MGEVEDLLMYKGVVVVGGDICLEVLLVDL